MTYGSTPYGQGAYGAGDEEAPEFEFSASGASVGVSWASAVGSKDVAHSGGVNLAVPTSEAEGLAHRQGAGSFSALSIFKATPLYRQSGVGASFMLASSEAVGYRSSEGSGAAAFGLTSWAAAVGAANKAGDASSTALTAAAALARQYEDGEAAGHLVSYSTAAGQKIGRGSFTSPSESFGSANGRSAKNGNANSTSMIWHRAWGVPEFGQTAHSWGFPYFTATGERVQDLHAIFSGVPFAQAIGQKNFKKDVEWGRGLIGGFVGVEGVAGRIGASSPVIASWGHAAGSKRALGAGSSTSLLFSAISGHKNAFGVADLSALALGLGRIWSGFPYAVVVQVWILEDRISMQPVEDRISLFALDDRVKVTSIEAITGRTQQ